MAQIINLKWVIKTLFGIIILIFFFSCKNSQSLNNNYLRPLNVEIPNKLKSNDSVCKFIIESTDLLNNWNITLGNLSKSCEQYIGRNNCELCKQDSIKLRSLMIEYVASKGEFNVNTTEAELVANSIKNKLTVEQLKSFNKILNTLDLRISEINKKHQFNLQN